MSLNIDIEFNEKENIWIVKPDGEIDIYTSSKLKDTLIQALNDRKTDVLIDCEKVQ